MLLIEIFIILATGSYELYIPFGIDVQKFDIGGGIYEEVEFHVRGEKTFTATGAEDDEGRWHGWIDIEYTAGEFDELVYIERV